MVYETELTVTQLRQNTPGTPWHAQVQNGLICKSLLNINLEGLGQLMAYISATNATVCDPFIMQACKRTEDAEIHHISLQYLTCFTVI